MQELSVNEITEAIIRAAMKVHSALGPGLLESAYRVCLAYELQKSGLDVKCQVSLPVRYEGVTLDAGYRVDILVHDVVVVELKAVEALLPVHTAQVLSYLKLSGKQVGLLINFKVVHRRDGIKRVVNELEEASPRSALQAFRKGRGL